MNSRREFIQNTLLASVACGTATEAVAKKPSANANPLIYPMRPTKAELSRELTVAIVGAGGRGWGYQGYGKRFPGTMKVVAVADFRLVRDFLMAVDKRDSSMLTSSLEASVESHLIGFACEESRLTGKKIKLHG